MQPTPKDEVIYCDSDEAHSFYFIKEGKVKITRSSEGGKEMILAILGPGELFGELCLADSQDVRQEKAITIEDSVVCLFRMSEVRKILEENPRLTLELTKHIGQKVRKIQRRLENLIFRTSEERVRDFLKEIAHEYGYKVANNPNEVAIPMRLTHEDIGKLTATSRQTVTSVLRNLAKADILTYDRHRVYIKNLQLL
ncbi:Crp/Fnr family transcriptional regulator [Telluribacter sp.]|uniref:Crp/Fnr family transcriptional regulator n=1 Tax=Telluribacter sp. TaxID=1978767 RepID=UPI002E1333F2|nr:Crp/Fnr family transcriptional regulator [Telluribacter sp.]